MRKYITISSIFIAALLAFTPLVSAEGSSTPANAADVILANYATPAEPEIIDDGVVQMLTPMSLDFYIDPFDLLGLGKVYSQSYPLENLGSTDLHIIIKDISVTFSNDTDFEALSAPFEQGTVSDKKAIYLVLNFSGASIPPVVLTATERSSAIVIPLPAGSDPVIISVSGDINSYPDEEWADGDVRIRLKYSIEAFTAVEEPIAPATPATPPATPAVATPENDHLWEPVGGDGASHEETLPEEPGPMATPAVPEPIASPGIATSGLATPGTVPEPESPQPLEATSGVV
jgi:hypothetical protein